MLGVEFGQLRHFLLAVTTGAFPHHDYSVLGVGLTHRNPLALGRHQADVWERSIAQHLAFVVGCFDDGGQFLRIHPSALALRIVVVDHVDEGLVHAHELAGLGVVSEVVDDVFEQVFLAFHAINQAGGFYAHTVGDLRQYLAHVALQCTVEGLIAYHAVVVQIYVVPVVGFVPLVARGVALLFIQVFAEVFGHRHIQHHADVFSKQLVGVGGDDGLLALHHLLIEVHQDFACLFQVLLHRGAVGQHRVVGGTQAAHVVDEAHVIVECLVVPAFGHLQIAHQIGGVGDDFDVLVADDDVEVGLARDHHSILPLFVKGTTLEFDVACGADLSRVCVV